MVDSAVQHQKWERNTYPGKRELLFKKLKMEKLKTKILLEITILNEQEPSVQSADKTKAVQV